jgi:hypothetical protein
MVFKAQGDQGVQKRYLLTHYRTLVWLIFALCLLMGVLLKAAWSAESSGQNNGTSQTLNVTNYAPHTE